MDNIILNIKQQKLIDYIFQNHFNQIADNREKDEIKIVTNVNIIPKEFTDEVYSNHNTIDLSTKNEIKLFNLIVSTSRGADLIKQKLDDKYEITFGSVFSKTILKNLLN